MSVERERVAGLGRLEDGLLQAGEWYPWGLYVSERQWGTVREDYSADGNAWDHLPHDHARSRAYRSGEDGLAGLDPAFAKYQLIMLCREWYQHPNGALPAYEWDFGDVNPPVHAEAALAVFAIDGGRGPRRSAAPRRR